jgi:hypothetical protein
MLAPETASFIAGGGVAVACVPATCAEADTKLAAMDAILAACIWRFYAYPQGPDPFIRSGQIRAAPQQRFKFVSAAARARIVSLSIGEVCSQLSFFDPAHHQGGRLPRPQPICHEAHVGINVPEESLVSHT